MDSSVSPTHSDHEGTAWNDYFRCKCYHTLFVFNQFSDHELFVLCKGNVHSADGCKEGMASIILRYRSRDMMRVFRTDASFANPELYHKLKADGYWYTTRLKGNSVLQEPVVHLLKRTVGRPSNNVRRFYNVFQ